MKSEKRLAALYPAADKHTLNEYVTNTARILSRKYTVISYMDVKRNPTLWLRVKCIYLNWLEGSVTASDRSFLLLMKLCGVGIVWVLHNKLPHECTDSEKAKSDYRFLARICSLLIIHSENSRLDAKRLLSSKKQHYKIRYLPHVNYIENYPDTRYNLRGQYHLGDSYVFLFIGQIRPYKNIELLIDSFRKCGFNDSKLIIAGRPSDSQYAKKLKVQYGTENDIIFCFGHIPSKVVQRYIKTADVLIYPYAKDSCLNSGAMIMAFSCRRTVIVPDIAMARDFEPEGFIYMYSYKNRKEHLENLCMQMKEAYESGREYNLALGERAYKYVKGHCSEKKIAKELLRWI